MATASFGKRGVARVAARPAASVPAAVEEVTPSEPSWAAVEFQKSPIPFASLAILSLLILVFEVEIRYAGSSNPSFQALIALGGMGHGLVVEHGQVWRVFTAAFLHGSWGHLISNAFGLLVAGFLLEPLIGRAWYLAIFFVGAIGSAFGSMMETTAPVSIGASGAIMALLGAVVVWCLPSENRVRSKKLYRTAVILLVTSLFPAATSHIDVGAHSGGAIAGFMMGLLLLAFWPTKAEHPGHTRLAMVIAGAGVVFTAMSFALVAAIPAPDVGQSLARQLIPDEKVPHTYEEQIAQASDLVRLYPNDPRSHIFHALSYLKLHEITEAQSELRTAMAKTDNPIISERPKLRRLIRLVLAVTMSVQQRQDDARALLQPDDCEYASSPSQNDLHAAYQQLKDTGICS